ncbi:hypothetical protein DE146DRAFT_664801 [Phaeosphaeria sp. MPI-PUGE-AT-0046c]|nr:hypothetical protein DE146DRAFT_664801 [Phaeosphaeria sp. MPI-PUGE-AT-0046c]
MVYCTIAHHALVSAVVQLCCTVVTASHPKVSRCKWLVRLFYLSYHTDRRMIASPLRLFVTSITRVQCPLATLLRRWQDIPACGWCFGRLIFYVQSLACSR